MQKVKSLTKRKMRCRKKQCWDKNAFLVSETDAKGIIRFANEDFCNIAGYSLEEMLGKPHNMVQHKDMPKATFKSLWDTVQKRWNLDWICKKCNKRWWILLGFCNCLSIWKFVMVQKGICLLEENLL